jgi:hypothetical protein
MSIFFYAKKNISRRMAQNNAEIGKDRTKHSPQRTQRMDKPNLNHKITKSSHAKTQRRKGDETGWIRDRPKTVRMTKSGRPAFTPALSN